MLPNKKGAGPAMTSASGYSASDWKPIGKGCLVGSVTIATPYGLKIKCTVFEKAGEKWLSLPACSYQKSDGATGYDPVVSFTAKALGDEFQFEGLELFERLLQAGAKS